MSSKIKEFENVNYRRLVRLYYRQKTYWHRSQGMTTKAV